MKNLDFTFAKYQELCLAILHTEYVPLTVQDYFGYSSDKFIILRHDIDRKVENALKMAHLENELSIASTYYFRKTHDVFKPDIIKKISELGHEIGYHYEVLDKVKGDLELAIKLFEQELSEFRKLVDVKTVCMHGNPYAPWSNKELWREYDLEDFGIIGEPYLSIDYNKVLYLTDTGRTWNGKYSVYDVVDGSKFYKVKSTDDVINLIKSEKILQKCILAHPNRWNNEFGAWFKELVWQNVKNVGKAGIKFWRKML